MTITQAPQQWIKYVLLVGLITVVTACGGGGGGGDDEGSGHQEPPIMPPDATPNTFSFSPATDAEPGAEIISNAVTISGINFATPISIVGGEYAIGSGAYTSAAGTITNNQSVTIKIIAPDSSDASAEAVLTVGDVEGKFSVATPVDTAAPVAVINFPPKVSLTEGSTILVRGTAADELNTVTEVSIGGFPATSTDGFANWTAEVTLEPGANTLIVTAMDSAGNEAGELASVTVHRAADLNVAFPNELVQFSEPQTVALDAERNRALVVDVDLRAIFAVDLATGVRSVLSENKPEDEFPLKLERPDFNGAGIAVDAVNDRALVGSSTTIYQTSGPTILSVDLDNGERTGLSDFITFHPTSLILDPTVGFTRVLLGQFHSGALLSFDLALSESGIISWSQQNIPNTDDPIETLGGIAIDESRNRALITTLSGAAHYVMSVDITSGLPRAQEGIRTVFSSSTIPNSDNPFTESGDYILTSIAIDTPNDRALLVDRGRKAIFDLALENGARSILSDATTPNAINVLLDPFTVHVEEGMSYSLVVDKERKALFAIDLVNGQRVIVSKSSTALPN